MTQMFIPKKLRVGFQTRTGTFSGKLAYVIYYDEKGNIRKEASWKTWCDKKTEVLEIDNIPQAGYILNKGVKRDGYWGSGRSVIRVHDPRDFEFEITVDNLMGILMHADVSKRDIQVECVFAWAGTELVLLPTNSQEYQDSVAYTAKQDQKISAKDFVLGYTYQPKKSDQPLTYIGHLEWFDWDHGYEHQGKLFSSPKSGGYKNENYFSVHKSRGKKHVFYNIETKTFMQKTAADFSSVVQAFPVENYADLVDLFFTTENSQKYVGIATNNKKKNINYYYNNNLYFVEEDNLLCAQIHHTNRWNANGISGDSFEYRIDFTANLLDFSHSLKKRGGTHISSNLTKTLNKEFKEKFSSLVAREHYKERENDIKKWLIDKGFGKNYSYILDNKKEITQI